MVNKVFNNTNNNNAISICQTHVTRHRGAVTYMVTSSSTLPLLYHVDNIACTGARYQCGDMTVAVRHLTATIAPVSCVIYSVHETQTRPRLPADNKLQLLPVLLDPVRVATNKQTSKPYDIQPTKIWENSLVCSKSESIMLSTVAGRFLLVDFQLIVITVRQCDTGGLRQNA